MTMEVSCMFSREDSEEAEEEFVEPHGKHQNNHVFFDGAFPRSLRLSIMESTPNIHVVVLLGFLYCGVKYIVDQISFMAYPWCDHPTQCFDYAQELRDSLNPDVDPCENFFEHVCGRWDRNYPYFVGVSQFYLLQMRVISSILHHLELPPTHPLPAVQKVVLAYQACLKVYKEGREDTKALFDIFQEFKFEWPSLSLSSDFDVMDMLLGLPLEYDLPTPFPLGLEPYLKTDTRYGLSLRFFVNSQESYFHPQVMTRCLPSVAPSLNKKRAGIVAERIRRVYTNIVSSVMNLYPTQRFTRFYTVVKHLATATEPFATLDTWLKVINKHLPQDRQITEHEEILIFNNVAILLRETIAESQRSEHVDLALFVGWSIIVTMQAGLSHALSDCLSVISFVALIGSAVQCVSFVDEVGAFAMTRFVVDTLALSRAVQTTQTTWAAVRNATRNSFRKLFWLDPATVAGAEDHVDNLISVVPLPAHLDNKDALEAFHDYLPPYSTEPFFVWLLAALKNQLDKKKRLLREGANVVVHREDLALSSTAVNAYYLPLNHIMVISAAIMGPPFVSPGVSRAVDLGAIGKVLGHELTHSFDPLFSDITRTGEAATWWSKQSYTNFTARLECVKYQLANYAHDSVHAKNALSETFADTAGTEKARLALDDLPSGEEMLGYTKEQLFFVAGCFEFCASGGYGYERTGNYPAFALRCNLPVSNQKQFARAFKCTEWDSLNPRDRCTFH